MKYPKPTDKYSCEVLCMNFMEIEERFSEIDRKGGDIVSSKSGESVVVTDSANAPMDSMVVYGKSWQNTVGGNQLFEKINSEGLGATVSADGLTATSKAKTGSSYVDLFSIYHSPISLTGGTTYYLSLKAKLVSGTINNLNVAKLLDANSGGFGTVNNLTNTKINNSYQRYVYSFTPTSDGEAVRLYIQGLTTVDAIVEVTDIMVSTVNTEWEPYVGGIPSPNPNYPQEIHSNGESGSIEYGVYGGNLFDANIITRKNVTVENGVMTFNVDTTDDYLAGSYGGTTPLINIQAGNYCVSCNDTNVRVTMYCVINGAYVNIDSTLSPITVSADTFIQGIRVRSINGTSLKGKPFTIMFNKGTLALPYEPYTKQPFTLQTPNGLNGLKVTLESEANYKDAEGNLWACDYVDFKRGKYVQRIVEKVLDGSESIGYHYGGVWHFSRVQLFGYEIIKPTTINSTHSYDLNGYYLMSDRFIVQTTDYMCAADNTKNKLYCSDKGSTLNYITFNASRFLETQDADGFKKFFGEHPTKIYAILETPIETDLTEEEIAQYKSLMMNYPNTTILNDANAYTEVGYVADTKCYIDNKFKELEIALANTNAQLL